MKLVINNRKKFNNFIFSLICFVTVLFVTTISQGVIGEMEIKSQIIHIKKGDNLWSIARSIAPNQNIQVMVAKIMKLNNMHSPQLYEHQALIIPVMH